MRMWGQLDDFDPGWPILGGMVMYGDHVSQGMVCKGDYGVDGQVF